MLEIDKSISQAAEQIWNHHFPEGYWWYTLEANDSIGAESILLMHYLRLKDSAFEASIANWLIQAQRSDGSWALFHGGPGDLSTTVECYLALKLAGYSLNDNSMRLARQFILAAGGITQIRIFSRIHLALVGLVDWSICPVMPAALIKLPDWSPINIYEFSSWARACLVPLLVIMDKKCTTSISGLTLDELYINLSDKVNGWKYSSNLGFFGSIFVKLDFALKLAEVANVKPMRKSSIKKCESYIREHLGETEDIYPAMYYSILALHALGHPLNDNGIQTAMKGLKSFQIKMSHNIVPEIPYLHNLPLTNKLTHTKISDTSTSLYQQCCISPVWDTAWAGVALLDAGISPSDQRLLNTGRWLLSKQITDVYGDWSVKNPGVEPGGWSFEFKNKHYPDVDDTIEVLTFLYRLSLPPSEVRSAFNRGLKWLISMQSSNGGFGAFDKDNNLDLLNKIPFSDHGACLDPATADISGRMIEFLLLIGEFPHKSDYLNKIADFIIRRQERNGSFWGRWGVNYIYGTWGALGGLAALGRKRDLPKIHLALKWLASIQNKDGGFGESCLSYSEGRYVPLAESTASQTAWALMTFVSCGYSDTEPARRAADYLMKTQTSAGGWDEAYHTGTGFPGHFYIRYHGYRYYFPLMALGKYRQALS